MMKSSTIAVVFVGSVVLLLVVGIVNIERMYSYNETAHSISSTTSASASASASSSNDNHEYTDFDMETAIVITTNLIPSHPSIGMLKETIASFSYLSGLSPNTQIYITVDPLIHRGYKQGREQMWAKEGKEREEEEERLEAYVTALYEAYEHERNYHILVNTKNIHIGGSLAKAVNLLDPNRTQFVYYVQHDFKFMDVINHTAMVKTMREYPDVLRLVRFNKRSTRPNARNRPCWNRTDAVNSVNGIHFTSTNEWSDNNHFSTVKHYKEILDLIVYVRRPIEAPMQHHAITNCTYYGPHIYGAPYSGPHIEHLDGRLGYGIENTTTTSSTTTEGTEQR